MKCPYPNCEYNTDTEIAADGSIEFKLQLLSIHERGVHPVNTQPVQPVAPSVEFLASFKLGIQVFKLIIFYLSERLLERGATGDGGRFIQRH